MRPLSIIGRGSRFLAGVQDETRERWIVSSAYFDGPTVCEPCEKVFQLHFPDIWEPGLSGIMDKVVTAWGETGEILPYRELIEEFGEIFPSSISWMLAYAIKLGYTDIALHGVDMLADWEYGGQRDYLFYLIGLARGRGVKVEMQEYSGVYLAPERYGVPL